MSGGGGEASRIIGGWGTGVGEAAGAELPEGTEEAAGVGLGFSTFKLFKHNVRAFSLLSAETIFSSLPAHRYPRWPSVPGP